MVKHKLAIYDMDKTISVRATYSGFLLHTAWRVAPWRLLLAPLVLLTSLGYGLKLLDRSRLKELNFAILLGRPTKSRLEAALNVFADDFMSSNIRSGAIQQIAADKQAGYRIVLATASFELYVRAIAARLGIDDVIATRLVDAPDGRITSQIIGGNCYAHNKLSLIHNWLGENGIDRAVCDIRCYSDHFSDQPMLELADKPIAANPDKKLRALANAQGWEIVDWT